MAKQLNQWELETIVEALNDYLLKFENLASEGKNFQGVIDGVNELGQYFTDKAKNKANGWGLSIDSRWDNSYNR